MAYKLFNRKGKKHKLPSVAVTFKVYPGAPPNNLIKFDGPSKYYFDVVVYKTDSDYQAAHDWRGISEFHGVRVPSQFYLGTFYFSLDNSDIGTLAHEAVHAVADIGEHFAWGKKPGFYSPHPGLGCSEAEETTARIVGDLTQQLYQNIHAKFPHKGMQPH